VVLPLNRREFLAGAAVLACAPEAVARALGGTPIALVTADLESNVVAVSLARERVVREIATPSDPRSIEAVGNDAVVGHTGAGVVTIIDGATLRVRRVLDGFAEPRYTVSAGDGRHAYVTDSGRQELVVLDVRLARVLRRVPLGGPARHVALDPTRRRILVALGNKAERVAVVDVSRPTRPRVATRFAPPFLAHDVGVGRFGSAWVTSGETRELAVYERGRVVARVPAGAPPQHVAFVSGFAFVTSGDDGTLRVHSGATGRLIGVERIPHGSFNVQRGWGRVLMPSLSRGTLAIANGRGTVVRVLEVARSSHDACFVMSA
jgi:DNA-binding beta-propeller fold protein YncE